jgi:ubiquinone/menaquinone biosynthesis C-methylase UbiE
MLSLGSAASGAPPQAEKGTRRGGAATRQPEPQPPGSRPAAQPSQNPANPQASSPPAVIAPASPSVSQPTQPGRQPDPTRRLFPPQDLGLLSAPDRDTWNKPDLIMDALGIADGAVVADLGAGGGWFTVRLARRVGPNGLVYAQDIQSQMLEATKRLVQRERLANVQTVLGTATDTNLPSGLDAVLIVDAFREMDEPNRPEALQNILRQVERALKPTGRLGIVEFLPGDGGPGPAAEDRVTPESVIETVHAAGLHLTVRETVPPFQYLLVFGKSAPPARRK